MGFSIKYLFLGIFLSFTLSFPPLCLAQSSENFREVRFSLKPALSRTPSDSPVGTNDRTHLELSAQVSYFFLPYLALAIPYSYSKQNNTSIHRTGLGPQLSLYFFDQKAHFDIQTAFQYNRILSKNKYGLNAEAQLGFMLDAKKTVSIGPYYAYHQAFLSDKDYISHSYGISINFRSFSDAHI